MKTKTATRQSRQRTHVMVTLPDEQRARVEAIAKQEDRSMTSVCRRFIEEGLARTTSKKISQRR
jgi:predicted transcriptional regulator